MKLCLSNIGARRLWHFVVGQNRKAAKRQEHGNPVHSIPGTDFYRLLPLQCRRERVFERLISLVYVS